MKLGKIGLFLASIPLLAACSNAKAVNAYLSNNRENEVEVQDYSALTLGEIVAKYEALQAEEAKLYEDNAALLEKALYVLFGLDYEEPVEEEVEEPVDEEPGEEEAPIEENRHHHREEEAEEPAPEENPEDCYWLSDEEFDWEEGWTWEDEGEWTWEFDYEDDYEVEWPEFEGENYEGDWEWEFDFEEEFEEPEIELSYEDILTYLASTEKFSEEELNQLNAFFVSLENIYKEYQALEEAYVARVETLLKSKEEINAKIKEIKENHADLWAKLGDSSAEEVLLGYAELSEEEKALLDEDLAQIKALLEELNAIEAELAEAGYQAQEEGHHGHHQGQGHHDHGEGHGHGHHHHHHE